MIQTAVYRIGNAKIRLCVPENMQIPENIKKFQVDSSEEDEKIQMTYHLQYVSDIFQIEQTLLEKRIPGKEVFRENLQLFSTSEGECRRINLRGIQEPYALTLTSGGHSQVWINESYREWMQSDTVFCSMLALEKRMIDTDAMILHSAYMCYQGEAILFSAPSETGKSTQAALWEKYRGSRTINGDRSLLLKEDGIWKACGWPVCGNSGICSNECYPIRAVVMLKQAKENRAYPLTGFRALREIMEQITYNGWDKEFQMKVMDHLENLLQEIPVYRLECDISENAVECLGKMFEWTE